MDDARARLASTPFPSVSNHIKNDPTPKDQAVYVPSISPGYAIDIYNQDWKRPLAAGLAPNGLNFLDPANRNFFHISHVMSSAGQVLLSKRYKQSDCIITKRDRDSTVLICDSGGYQIASGRLHLNDDNDRLEILRWQEKHANIAIGLDAPTGPIGDPAYKYKTFEKCLEETLYNLRFYDKWRSRDDVLFLNVLQGNTSQQCETWYQAVKHFKWEGWAIAGPRRHNINQFLHRILTMYEDGNIQDKKWLHVLGTCELETAVLLTRIQRSINEHMNKDLRVSYDTSSPSRIMAVNQIYTLPSFEGGKMTMPTLSIPDGFEFMREPGASKFWPWPSPLGNVMTMGDVCADRDMNKSTRRDKLSNYYMTHHNLGALCWGIALSNRVLDAHTISGQRSFAPKIVEAVERIDEVLESNNPAVLRKHAAFFDQLRRGKVDDGGEEDRCFD